ncbi:MAG: ClpXP protease specificity-enhancing factor [Enterobacterales bacterium]|nr:ClpXP protease specificity-enhancing factor [Enterobacterales bacterium]
MSIESFSTNKPYLFRAIYQWILDNDATPHILVDANWPAVVVPQEFVQQGKIILNAAPEAISHWFSDNDAVSFSARFAGKSMDIYLPIGAILAVYAQENNLGMAFEPEVKPEEENIPSLKPQAKRPQTESSSTEKSEKHTEKQSDSSKQSKSAIDKLASPKKPASKKSYSFKNHQIISF